MAASLTQPGWVWSAGASGPLGWVQEGPRKVTPAISADTIADGDIHWIPAERAVLRIGVGF